MNMNTKKAIRELGPTVCVKTLADYLQTGETALRAELQTLARNGKLLVDRRPCGHCGAERVRLS